MRYGKLRRLTIGTVAPPLLLAVTATLVLAVVACWDAWTSLRAAHREHLEESPSAQAVVQS